LLALQPGSLVVNPLRSTVSPLPDAPTIARKLPAPLSLQFNTERVVASAAGAAKANIAPRQADNFVSSDTRGDPFDLRISILRLAYR
jgi:hypothetical protein